MSRRVFKTNYYYFNLIGSKQADQTMTPVLKTKYLLIALPLSLSATGALLAEIVPNAPSGNAPSLNVPTPHQAVDAARPFYVPSTWTPRVTLPAADALRGDFAPPSPVVEVDYSAPGFAADRLSAVPAPGIHPRVFMSPSDIDAIRAKVALGDQAPIAFRKLWEVETKKKSAFYALVAKDEKLGRELAAALTAKAAEVEPMVDRVLKRPGLEKDNLWALSGTLGGEKSPDAEVTNLGTWMAYDYLYQWLEPAAREQIRRIIAKMTRGRSSNFLEIPDHWMINNHLSFGMGEFIPAQLLIEGEEGFDAQVFARSAHKARCLLTYYFAPSGMCYETIKGWLNTPVFLAVGRREHDLLKHGHLLAKMRYQLQAARWEIAQPSGLPSEAKMYDPANADARWRIREEMRNSAFHVNFLMHWLYPQDPAIDFLYKASLQTHHLDDATPARDIATVGCSSDVLLLLADAGMVDAAGKPYSCEDQARLDALKAPTTWSCPQRGYLEFHNSWRKDDLHLSVFGKQDFIYNGHEGPEQGRFLLWKDGINWAADVSMLFNKTAALQHMVTVDGKGAIWPPASSTWLGVVDAPLAATAVVDYKDSFSFQKVAQVPPFNAPQVATARFKGWDEGNFLFSRDQQLPFHDVVVKFHDGYAHTDYGTWNGETRVTEQYRDYNPMEQAFRTVHAVRGERPYVLFLDDLRKDGGQHLYEWNMTLPGDVELLSSTPSGDLVFGRIDTPRTARTMFSYQPELNYQPKKGDPLLLIRVLNRSGDGMPTPHYERFEGWTKVTIPSVAVEPEFRVLLYPHRSGDPLPVTEWNERRTSLSVAFPKQVDTYHFGRTDGARAVLAQERDGKRVTTSGAGPARPVFAVRGTTFDAYAHRYTRSAGAVPRYLVDSSTTVTFRTPPMGQEVHYTLDGSEPTAASPRADAPLAITGNATLRAQIIAPGWAFGPEASAEVRAEFRAVAPEPADTVAAATPGLLMQAYEVATVPYDNRGFFDAKRVMLPDVRKETPVASRHLDGFHLPTLTPATPQFDQKKGFFRFTGSFNAPTTGIYQFAVDSCGPVTFDIGHQVAIESIGQYHQQQQIRRGEVALAAGWHTVALTVCDPVFWKVNTEGTMPLRVTYRVNGGDERDVASDQLSCDLNGVHLDAEATPAVHQPVALLVEPGLEAAEYDRLERIRADDLLDIDGLKPFARRQADEILANPTAAMAVVYDGYFRAPADGIYTFDAPARTPDSYDRNQLRIGDEVVVQHGVPGRNPARTVTLKAGLHPISLRLGASRAGFTVIYPGTTNPVQLTAEGLHRPQRVGITAEGHEPQRQVEIFTPTRVILTAPAGALGAEIHYTLDGRVPTASSPVTSGPVLIERSATITAAAFRNGAALTVPNAVRVDLVDLPEAQLLAWWDFAGGAEALAKSRRGTVTARIAGASPAQDPAGPAAAFAGGKANLHVDGLGMSANALTVSMWLKMTAPGKQLVTDSKYHVVVDAGSNGKDFSINKAGRGGVAKPASWQHVVFVWDGAYAWIAVDGEVVSRARMKAQLQTNSLDLLVGYEGLARNVRIYNRALDAQDIARITAVEAIRAKGQTL